MSRLPVIATFKSIALLCVGLPLLVSMGCSDEPVQPVVSDKVIVDGRLIEITGRNASRNGMPGSDTSLGVSVTVTEAAGKSLEDVTVDAISVIHDMGRWYPSEVETRHNEVSPSEVWGVASGGPPWPGGSVVHLDVTLYSLRFGRVHLHTTALIAVAY